MKKSGLLFYLERSVDCTKELLHYVKNEDSVVLESVSTGLARKALKLSRDVGGDMHRGKSFTRLKVSKNGILHGKLEIKHKVEDLIVRFFVHRFPRFTVVLESWRGCHIYGKGFDDVVFTDEKLKDVVKELDSTVVKKDGLEVAEDVEKVWEEFYNSQYISSRKNLKLFGKVMPKKYKTWETENLQKTLGCKKLDEVEIV